MILERYAADASWAIPIVDRHLETAPVEVRMAWRTFKDAVSEVERLAQSQEAEERAAICAAVVALKAKLAAKETSSMEAWEVLHLIETELEEWE